MSKLTEANKYLFGTESTSEVRKLFEGVDDYANVMRKTVEVCAKKFDKYLLKLAQGDRKSMLTMVDTALRHRILNGRQPWDGMDMVLGLFDDVTDYASKIDMYVSYPFVSKDGDTIESKEDLYPASLPYIDEMLEKYCTKGFTALYNRLHPENVKPKVTYSEFCQESHKMENVTRLSSIRHIF